MALTTADDVVTTLIGFPVTLATFLALQGTGLFLGVALAFGMSRLQRAYPRWRRAFIEALGENEGCDDVAAALANAAAAGQQRADARQQAAARPDLAAAA